MFSKAAAAAMYNVALLCSYPTRSTAVASSEAALFVMRQVPELAHGLSLVHAHGGKP